MSTGLDELCVRVPCAYCNAQPDDWCQTKSGGRATWFHAARTGPIYDTYGSGYHDGYSAGYVDAELRLKGRSA